MRLAVVVVVFAVIAVPAGRRGSRPPRGRAFRDVSYGPRITRPAATVLADGAKRLTVKQATGLGIVILALVISSCGGSSSAAPTQAQFASRADALCAGALRSAGRLKTPKSAAELLPFSERASAIVSKLTSQLKGVTPPPKSRVAYNRFLIAAAREARTLGELVQALRAGSTARARAALQALNSNAVNEEAKALGITECARTVRPG